MIRLAVNTTVALIYFMLWGKFIQLFCTAFIPPFCAPTFLTQRVTSSSVQRYHHGLMIPSSSVRRMHWFIPNISQEKSIISLRVPSGHVFQIHFQRKDDNEIETSFKADYSTTNAISDKRQLELMEREVVAATQSKLDWKYVQDALFGGGQDKLPLQNTTATYKMKNDYIGFGTEKSLVLSSIEISLASSTLCAALCYAILQQPIVACLVFSFVFIMANGNPLQEDNAFGALFRIVGRLTLQVLYSITPKVQRIMRVLLTDDDNKHAEQQLRVLQGTIKQLEEENETLRQRIATREKMDSILAQCTTEELKTMARKENLPVSGTKEQILSRLVDKGIFNTSN